MSVEINCPECGNKFGSQEAMEMHRAARHPTAGPSTKPSIKNMKKMAGYGFVALVMVGIAYWWFFTPHYEDPPFEFKGQPHPETHPESFFLDEPISIPVQIHILEHGPNDVPGALAQYNCKKEEPACAALVQDLRGVVSSFDERNPVYVAPYYKVDALIVLTGRGKIEKLKSYDEARIRAFFGSIGVR